MLLSNTVGLNVFNSNINYTEWLSSTKLSWDHFEEFKLRSGCSMKIVPYKGMGFISFLQKLKAPPTFISMRLTHIKICNECQFKMAQDFLNEG